MREYCTTSYVLILKVNQLVNLQSKVVKLFKIKKI